MVHFFKKKAKVDLNLIDDIASKLGWKIEEEKTGRYYVKGDLKIKFAMIKSGYKIMLFKKNKLYDADITNSKEMAMTLLGESVMFRKW